MLFLLCFLIASSFASFNDPYDKYLFQERWLPLQEDFPNVNLTNVTPLCRNDTRTWLKSLKQFSVEFELCIIKKSKLCTKGQKEKLKTNLYALKQLDAFGRLPAGMLDIKSVSYGSMSECQEVSKHFVYPTKYCFLESTINGGNCSNLAPLRTAVCMPKSCSNNDITEIFRQLSVGLLNHCHTSCVEDHADTNAFTWIFTAFMGVLLALCLLGSVLDYILENVYNLPSKNVTNPVLQVFLAFSIYTNGAYILDTRPAREGHLKSLDCIRFFSMLWVVSGHVFSLFELNDSILDLRGIQKPILVDTLMNAFYSVDTFFVISGLLVSYMFTKMTIKNPRIVKSPFTWIMFYVHRYLRLTPPYMLFLCFYMVVAPLITGVFFTLQHYDKQYVGPCRQYWWQNLIYINNFNVEHPCYAPSWYLACDTQMYIAAPIVLVAFFLSHWIGLASVLAIGAGSVTASMVLIIKDKLPGVAAFGTLNFMTEIYTKPWIRCTPYLIGMYTGYLLAHHGHKKIKLNPILVLAGWAISIAMALAIIYGPHDYLALETKWSHVTSAFYYSFSRIGWGIFICWVVVANHFGWAGPISTFMCHPLWQPLGRLSYTAYIVHAFWVFTFMNLFDRPIHFVTPWSQFLSCTIPITVIAYIFAFFWSCLCEHPFLKLEKLLVDGLTGSKKPRVAPSQNQVIEDIPKEKPVENWGEEPEPEKTDDFHL